LACTTTTICPFGERDLPNHIKGSSEDDRDEAAPAHRDAARDYALNEVLNEVLNALVLRPASTPAVQQKNG